MDFILEKEKQNHIAVRSEFFSPMVVESAMLLRLLKTALARSVTKYQLNFIQWQRCSFIEHLISVRCFFLLSFSSSSLNKMILFRLYCSRIHASVSLPIHSIIYHIYVSMYACMCMCVRHA